MQEYCQIKSSDLFISDIDPLKAQYSDCQTHEVHCAQSMLEPRVLGRRIGIVCKSELLDPAHPLEVWMLDHIKNRIIGNRYKSVDRIIEILLFIGCEQNQVNLLKKYKTWLPGTIKANLRHLLNQT
jgi:hypothetical protein